ncbi:MAG TPA: hypothetical protein VKT81_19155 [Bryobacteraceae bacterium]|nr:hypothetical protein [Bryobacteraceae bacterium]
MKKAKSVALIGAGKLTDSSLSRFYWLSDRLGPVKSSSFRLASRIANRLRAGYPVKDYEEFQSSELILVCVPEPMLPEVLEDLASAPIDFNGKAVVLSSLWGDSGELRRFSALGAAIGSICMIPGFDDLRYLVEGDRLAVWHCRRLVEHRERRAVTIERSLKPFYLAALACTGSVLFSVLMAADQALRMAGVASADSSTILQRQVSRTVRSFVRTGGKALPDSSELSGHVRALAATNPDLADYMERSARLAEKLVESRKFFAASS